MSMPKLKKINFGENKFRKLGSLELEFGERITAIGGLNGIGKSTILGLIANGSGIRESKFKSYFNLNFQAQFQEIFHLSVVNDYFESTKEKPYVKLTYNISGHDFEKQCSVSKHGESRLKVVPRTIDKSLGKNLNIGNDARVPIPTIYLGMSRVLPMGEVTKDNIKTTQIRSMDEEDKAYMFKLFSSVIKFDTNGSNTIIDHDVKHSNKKFKLPELSHDTLSISLGQDSLSSIFTALASFNYLKREYSQYESGILIIDEIDAGLHHVAQIKLIELLKKESRKLNLQIIFTTHSLTIFKNLLEIPKKQQELGTIPDKVIYLYDSHSPKAYINPTYLQIKNNQLSQVQNNNVENNVKIYFEDDESLWFFKQLLHSLNIDNIEQTYYVKIELISLKLSCNMLLDLAKADSYFNQVIVVLDNDVLSQEKAKNIINENTNFLALPSCHYFDDSTGGFFRTPEKIIYDFLGNKVNHYDKSFWDSMTNLYASQIDYDYVNNSVLTIDFESSEQKNREKLKEWFQDHKALLEKIKLVDIWTKENETEVNKFKIDFQNALSFCTSQTVK